MKTNRKAGFTLIELLVVIAIIGILSSIVLVSLNGARKKGSDTRVISDVQETRTSLESGFSGVYPDLWAAASQTNASGTMTTNGPDVANMNQLYADAASQGGALNFVIATNATAGSGTVGNTTAYAIYGRLVSNTSAWFCIDSTGKADQSETANNTAILCP